jgi:hypothetical protein
MVILAFLGSQCKKFHAAGWMCWFFTSFHLSRVSGLMRFHPGFWQLIRSSSVFTSARSFVRSPPTMQPSCPGLSMVMRTGLTVMTLRQSNNPPNIKIQTHQDRKRRDRWRAKSRACSSFSLTSRGLFIKNSSWQAEQSSPHTTVMFYSDCVKMCEDFALNFGDKKLVVASWQHTVSHFLFHRGIFYQNQHDCHPPPTLLAWLGPCNFSLFHQLKIKLRGCHFDTVEVTEAESQAVLNTLTVHNFQDVF